MIAAVDVLLLVAIICFIFGVGSALLVAGHRTTWRQLRSAYTMRRWLTNPFKVCLVAMLWQANFQQLALTGPSPSVAGDLDYRGRLFLTVANLIGGCIAFVGLHLRDFEMSLWIEVSAYISLIGTLGIWITLIYLTVPLPNTSYGLNATEAFVLAAVIRSWLILRYKLAVAKRDIPKQARLGLILGGSSV